MISLFQRLRTRHRLKRCLKLWYRPGYDPPSFAQSARTRGIIPGRSQRILYTLIQQKLVRMEDLHPFPWLSLDQLRSVHPDSYLETITQPEILGRIFGIPPEEVHVDDLLTSQRWAASGTLAGAKWLLKKKSRVCFNLGGGFHHAEPEQGSGFCVFNDVAIAVTQLRQEGFHGPISIIDLDYHQGNGNIVAFAEDPSVSVYSLHGSVWTHVQGINTHNIQLPEHAPDDLYLKTLKETLPPILLSHHPGLIFYIAGNDVLKDDPLGGFDLTLMGLLQRDRFVTDWCLKQKVPVLITLAGGYSLKALTGSLNFLYSLLGYQKGISFAEEKELHERFSHIFSSLEPYELQKEDGAEFKFTEADILGSLDRHAPQRKILGFYSAHGIEFALENYGFFKKIREFGYEDFRVSIDPADPYHQMIRVEGRPSGKPPAKHLLLTEVVLRQESIPFPQKNPEGKHMNLLFVEWLLLQDPLREFSLERPRFPGQKHPGLGIAQETKLLFIQMCKRLHLDGILNHPSYYHVAVASPGTYFLNPEVEGRFRALQKVLKDQELVVASRLVEDGGLQWGDGKNFRWEASDHVFPISEKLIEHFNSEDFLSMAKKSEAEALEAGLHIKNTAGK